MKSVLTRLMKIILTEKSGKSLLIAGIIFLIIALIIFFWNDYSFSFDNQIEADKVGQFGDLVGGLIGSIWALAGVVLFYVALTEQRKDFETNRKVLDAQTEALTLQLKEFKLQRKELTETRELFKIQKFETSFFNLLRFHNETRKALFIRVEKIKPSKDKKEKEVFVFDGIRFFIKGNQLVDNYLFKLNNLEMLIGQNLDDSIMNYVNNKFRKKFIPIVQDIVNEKGALVTQKIAFLGFYQDYVTVIDRYMKQFLIAVEYIDKTDKEIVDFSSEVYISLLKSQLSDLELKFIWIYCQTFNKEEDLELLTSYLILPQRISPFEPNEYKS